MHIAAVVLLAASLTAAPPEALTPPPSAAGPRSIYRINPALDGALIAAGTVASAIPYLFAKQLIHPRCPCDPREVNGFDRGSIGDASKFADDLSDVTMVAAVAAPPLLDALDLGVRGELLEDLVVYAETMAIDTAFVSVTKAAVQRPLPRVYAGDAGLINTPNGYRSFYSGHTTSTVAALSAGAMTWTLRHGDTAWNRTWPWLVTGLVGSSVAAERVLAGRHFVSDVLVGAATGAAIGILVPYLHARAPAVSVGIAPADGGGQLAVSLRL
jgi:membrane-associated phospholipid phosphatase